MGFTKRQRVFIEEYLQCWNAAEAARRAGYSERNARTIGAQNLAKLSISTEIQRRIQEKTMSADEVLMRLADQARGDIGDFLDIVPGTSGVGIVNLEKAKAKTHIVKKYKFVRDKGVEIELYDAQAALVHLGKHLGLFKGDEADWRVEIVVLIREQRISFEALERELGRNLATELFESAGVSIVAAGEGATGGGEE